MQFRGFGVSETFEFSELSRTILLVARITLRENPEYRAGLELSWTEIDSGTSERPATNSTTYQRSTENQIEEIALQAAGDR